MVVKFQFFVEFLPIFFGGKKCRGKGQKKLMDSLFFQGKSKWSHRMLSKCNI